MRAVRLQNGNLLIPVTGGSATGTRIDGHREITPDDPEYAEWTRDPESIVDELRFEGMPQWRIIVKPDADTGVLERTAQDLLGVPLVGGRAGRDGVVIEFGEAPVTLGPDGAEGRLIDIYRREGGNSALVQELRRAVVLAAMGDGVECKVMASPAVNEPAASYRLPWG